MYSYYYFIINIKSQSFTNIFNNTKPIILLELICRCFPGELLRDLANKDNLTIKVVTDFFRELNCVEFLIFVDGNVPQEDEQFSNALKNLQPHILPEHQQRIALVFSMFETPNLQQYRNDIEKFAEPFFPRTVNALDDFSEYKNCDVSYFACSAFGLIKEDGKLVPNVQYIGREDWSHFGVIKDPKRWTPFGVVAPIYWLLTGEHDKRLLKIELLRYS